LIGGRAISQLRRCSDGKGGVDGAPGTARTGGARSSTPPLRARAARRSRAPCSVPAARPPRRSRPTRAAGRASRCVRTRRRTAGTCTPVSLSSPASSSSTTWAWARRAAGGYHRRSHRRPGALPRARVQHHALGTAAAQGVLGPGRAHSVGATPPTPLTAFSSSTQWLITHRIVQAVSRLDSTASSSSVAGGDEARTR
jgi:hypothetical protein